MENYGSFVRLGDVYPQEFEQLEENYWNSCAAQAYEVKEIEEQLIDLISLREEAEKKVGEMLKDSGEPVSNEDRERLVEELVLDRIRELEAKKAELMGLDVALQLNEIEKEESKEEKKWRLIADVLMENDWVGAFARLKILSGEANVQKLLKFAAVVPRSYAPDFVRVKFKGQWVSGKFFRIRPDLGESTVAMEKSVKRHLKKQWKRLLKKFKKVRKNLWNLQRGAESWESFKKKKEVLWKQYKVWKTGYLENLRQKKELMIKQIRQRLRNEKPQLQELELCKVGKCGEGIGYRFVNLGANWYLIRGRGPWAIKPNLLAFERKAYLDLQRIWNWAENVPMKVPDNFKKININKYSIHWRPNGLRVLGQERIWPQIKVRRQMQIV